MFIALILATLQFIQSQGDLWVATEANDREVSAINAGWAFVPEGADYRLAQSYTVHRQGTAATRGTPAYTEESIGFRCEDRTFLVRGSRTLSSVADPINISNRDGAFVSVATDPKRQRQAEAVCRDRADQKGGFRNLTDLLQAHGVRTGGPTVLPRLPGPRPYPVAPGTPAPPPGEPPNVIRPPRIGVDASSSHSPGGLLLVGQAVSLGGRVVTELYLMGSWVSEPADEPVIFARRALDSWEAQEQIRWADSRACPGLVEAMRPVNDLPLPTLILPLDGNSRARARELGFGAGPAPDGPGPHIFWGATRGPVGIDFQFSSYGGPWVEWSQSMDRVLQPCWQDARPVSPARN